MLVEDKENRITAVYDNKCIYIFETIIPDGLVKDFKTSKKSVLLYHTEPKIKIKVRKQPDEKRLQKEIKKFIKENK